MGWNNSFSRRKTLDLVNLDPKTLDLDKSIFAGLNIDKMLPQITCPVLMIYGNPELGSILTRDEAEHIVSTIPNCVFEFMEDVGHAPQQENPAKSFTMISNFLESL